MAGIIHKISDSISRSRSRNRDPLQDSSVLHHSHLNPSFADTPEEEEKSDRGRDYVPTGRGGIGNMSHSRGRQPNPNTSDESPEVLAKARSTSRSRANSKDVIAGGRGGAGNIRSPSRDPGERAQAQKLDAEEAATQAEWEEKHKDDMVTGGRGGMGNIGAVRMKDALETAKEEEVTED